MNIHYGILDDQRINVLPKLLPFRELGFYLAGGTALALQIGHRDSIDFDFFCLDSFDTTSLFSKIEQQFFGHNIVRLQDELNILEIVVDDVIRLSFMTYKYQFIEPVISTDFFDLASIVDIGCMKLSAITSRTAYKDYVDLYFILNEVSLQTLIDSLRVKLPTLDPSLALKSLVYFDDITPEEILYKINPVDIEVIKSFLIEQVKTFNQ